MSRYFLRLYEGLSKQPVNEPLDADDDEDARAFAQMRLLLTRDYTHVHIYEGDRQIDEFHRSTLDHQPR